MNSTNAILVTGGAGFIGSNLVRHLLSETENKVVVFDKLSYAGNLESLHPCRQNEAINSRSESDRIASYRELITFVEDRPGHDLRYAIDASKIARELDWRPKEDFASGFRKTVQWYLEHREWWQRILAGEYRLQRIGLTN